MLSKDAETFLQEWKLHTIPVAIRAGRSNSENGWFLDLAKQV